MSINIPNSRKEVVDRMLTDVQSELPTSRPFIRNHYIRALIIGIAGRMFEFYIQLRTLITELFPDTATGSFLDRWGSYVNITRNLPSVANGLLTIGGVNGTLIPASTAFQSDGNQYISIGAGTILPVSLAIESLTFSAGIATAKTSVPHNFASSIIVTISNANNSEFDGVFSILVTALDEFTYLPTATPPPSDGVTPALADATITTIEVNSVSTGLDKNLANGAKITITSPIAGANNNGFVQFSEIGGGTDTENDSALRIRILDRYRNPNTPFNVANLINEAKKIGGVTRVFVFSPDLAIGAVALASLERIEDKTCKATFGSPHGLLSGSYIGILGASPIEYNTDNILPLQSVVALAVSPTELIYTVPIDPPSSPATGTIRAEFSSLQPGQTRVLFMRDNDIDPIPTPSEVTDVKTQLLKIKPAHMAEVDLIVEAPIALIINFEFESISPNTATMRASIESNLEAFFRDETSVGRVIAEGIYTSIIFATVDLQTGDRLRSFRLVAPIGDIQVTDAEIPLLGTVEFN